MRLGTGLHIAAPRRRGSTPPPGPTMLVHDVFDEAADTRLELHAIAPTNLVAANWDSGTSGAASDDDAFLVEAGTGWLRLPGFADGDPFATHDVGTPDFMLELVIAWLGNEFDGGPVMRYTDPSSYFWLEIYQPADPADSSTALFAVGSFGAELIDLAVLPDMTAEDHTWRITCEGANWSVHLDGVPVLEGNSSRHLAATRVGVHSDEGGAAEAIIRDWKVYAL